VREQVTHRHLGPWLDESLRPVFGSLADLQVTPLRNEACHRVAELEHRALIERHQRHTGDRLGHRVDTPDRVLLDGRGPFPITASEGPEVANMTMAGDGDLAAGDTAWIDVPGLEMLGDPFKLPLVESRACRIDLH
jgi:hypothetical protein